MAELLHFQVNLFFINAYLDRFLHFLLPQIPRLIFHNQIELIKFGRRLRYLVK